MHSSNWDFETFVEEPGVSSDSHPEVVADPAHRARAESPELSVVIPCLNEADTLAECLATAERAISEHRIEGEIVVADNGSTDGSAEIALRLGARLVRVARPGYGSALRSGIAAARGRFIVMGDADGSYDFSELPRFLDQLRKGYDLVQGCRLPVGGGTIKPRAMPFLHRWIGNPMFSLIARRWFKSPIHDVYCGLRGFSKAHYERLDQESDGMEFAPEMIIKSAAVGARMAEIPVTLYPDGRKVHRSHLRTFSDGWRTLGLFLLCYPRWLFVMPGLLLVILGICGYVIALPGLHFRGISFDAHTLLFASLAMVCGYQSIFFGIIAQALAGDERALPRDPLLSKVLRAFNLEAGLLAGGGFSVVGLVLLLAAVYQWYLVHFGSLIYAHTMRLVVPGVMLSALGFQTITGSLLICLLHVHRFSRQRTI